MYPKPGSKVKNLLNSSRKRFEVMVKIPKPGKKQLKGLKAAARHIFYIGRNGELNIEDENGVLYGNPKEFKDVIRNWKQSGMPWESESKTSINLVLSVPGKHVSHDILKEVAREFGKEIFNEYHYVFATHDDSDNNHIHFCINNRNFVTEQNFHPNKYDLQNMRECFAEKLRERGIECSATRRYQRGLYDRNNKPYEEYQEERKEKWKKARPYRFINFLVQEKDNGVEYDSIEKMARLVEEKRVHKDDIFHISKVLYAKGLKKESNLFKKVAKQHEIEKLEKEKEKLGAKILSSEELKADIKELQKIFEKHNEESCSQYLDNLLSMIDENMKQEIKKLHTKEQELQLGNNKKR